MTLKVGFLVRDGAKLKHESYIAVNMMILLFEIKVEKSNFG